MGRTILTLIPPNPIKAYNRARKGFRVFNTLRKRRQARKAQRNGEELTEEQIELLEEKPIMGAFIKKKAVAATKSLTVGVAGGLVGLRGIPHPIYLHGL